MAYVQTTGLWMPERFGINTGLSFNNIGPIVATGDKAAFVGRVWTPNRGSKNITKVGFRFGGGLVKAGGSGLTVSLQDVDLANGPPFRFDGTQDQTVAIANGNASFASNTWIQTAALSATRTVSHGDRLAVVVEYDGSGRLGADSVSLCGVSQGSIFSFLDSGPVTLLSSSYSAVASTANGVILEFDDGTFGTLDYGSPMSAVGTDAFNSGSGTNNIGMQFTVPFNCKVDGAWLLVTAFASADFDLILYSVSGTTLTSMATASADANASRAAATTYFHETLFTEQTLVTGTTYYLGVKPSTANNVTIYNYSVNAAGHFAAFGGGTSWQYNTASGTTLGTATTTKRPLMGLRISAVDDGTGSGSAVGVIGG